MTLDNLMSAIRALLILIGSYLVGHAFFGHTLTQDSWSVIAGAIMTFASTIWGISTKTATLESVESAIRSIVTALGGMLAAAGVISSNNVNAVLGFLTAAAPLVQSVLSKQKNAQIASGSMSTTATGKAIDKK